MSNNLVKRLRDWEHVWPDDMDKPAGHLYEDAADRIEALEERAETLEELVMDVVADLREGVSASKIDYRIGKVMQKLEWDE